MPQRPTPTSTRIIPRRFVHGVWLSPSTPAAAPEAYQLRAWSDQWADDLIATLGERAELIDHHATGFGRAHYHTGYAYVAMAEAEALRRFPDSPRADRWMIDQTTHAAYVTYREGGRLLQDFIVATLNDRWVHLSNLTTWLTAHPTLLSFDVHSLPALPGYLSSSIINISEYDVGAHSFWLLEDQHGFKAYPLFNYLEAPMSTNYIVVYGDLTGDGFDEFVAFLGNHNGSFIGGNVGVMDLGQVPPVPLSLGLVPIPMIVSWPRGVMITLGPAGPAQLVISGLTDSSCMTGFDYHLAWNGRWLDLVQPVYSVGTVDETCLGALVQGGLGPTRVEREAALAAYGPALSAAAPPGTLDARHYQLALYHALLGQQSEAVALLQPIAAESAWYAAAQQFLTEYQTPADSYTVCQHAAVDCNLSQALEQLVLTLPLGSLPQAGAALQAHGVSVLASGVLNPDPAVPARWITLRHPSTGQIEFWVITESDQAPQAVYVSSVTSANPAVTVYATAGSTLHSDFPQLALDAADLVFSLDSTTLFTLVRRPTDRAAFVTRVPGFAPIEPTATPVTAASMLLEAIAELLADADPAAIVERLLALAQRPDFEPDNSYRYYLGLAYELSGNGPAAVQAYIETWHNCCVPDEFGPEPLIVDPFAVMAQAKLELRP